MKDLLKYLYGSATKNTTNTIKAGRNNRKWGIAGGIIGLAVGVPTIPITGPIGMLIGGLLGSGISYKLSQIL